MSRQLILISVVTLLSLLGGLARADLIVAENLLVDLRAEDLPYGTAATWPNRGSLGSFTARGTPAVEHVHGLKAVTFDSTCWFDGPTSTPGIEGAGTRSIEVWAYNPSIPGEETTVSWSHRGGPNGSNMAFNYGNSNLWGAVGHWGGDTHDMGWWTNHIPAPAAGKWWHLVYTYDGVGARVYVNGVEESVRNPIAINTYGGNIIRIAAQADDTGAGVAGISNFTGSIAEVRIHDGVLSPAAILNNFKLGGPKKAYDPVPADGAINVPKSMLSWSAGNTAVAHDVYFGTDQTAVTNADTFSPEYIEQTSFTYCVNSLVMNAQQPQKTYYWRIDEIDEGENIV